MIQRGFMFVLHSHTGTPYMSITSIIKDRKKYLYISVDMYLFTWYIIIKKKVKGAGRNEKSNGCRLEDREEGSS